ncbi:MAG: hypothetical protein QM759_04295 [Terricaulis sp.]
MLLLIWMSVLAQAFFPGGHSLAVLQAQAYEAHLRAELDMPAPVSAAVGAASHVVHYQMPKLAAAF